MFSVYEIFCPISGKRYIGCTKKNPDHRWEKGNGYLKNSCFHDDIIKYGWNTFIKSVLFSSDNKDEALGKEEYYIKELHTLYPDGYNLRSGGRSNFPVESVCRNISRSKMGHEVRSDVRVKLSEYGKRPVVQLDMDFKYIRVYASLTEAAQDVGGYKTNIYAACKGKKPTSCGYRWMYQDDYILFTHSGEQVI